MDPSESTEVVPLASLLLFITPIIALHAATYSKNDSRLARSPMKGAQTTSIIDLPSQLVVASPTKVKELFASFQDPRACGTSRVPSTCGMNYHANRETRPALLLTQLWMQMPSINRYPMSCATSVGLAFPV